MAYTQVATLTDFTAGTTIVSAEVDANFTAIRDVVNGVVTGSNTLAADTITEVTSAGGVTIDSVVLKDGGATLTAALTGTTVTLGTQIEGTTANGYLDLAGDSGATVKLRLTDAGLLALGDTANTKSTVGLTINQGANDDRVIVLKSSDVAHGVTDQAETDDYAQLGKYSGTTGGAYFQGYGEGENGVGVQGVATSANTTKTSSGEAPIVFDSVLKSGTTTTGVSTNGNLVVFKTGGNGRFIIDTEGDFHYDGADGGAFDAEDDVALVRAFALATSKDTIRTDFDDFVRYSEDDLVRLGILGDRVENGGLVNGAQLQRLLVGAVWQQAQAIEAMRTEIKALTP